MSELQVKCSCGGELSISGQLAENPYLSQFVNDWVEKHSTCKIITILPATCNCNELWGGTAVKPPCPVHTRPERRTTGAPGY